MDSAQAPERRRRVAMTDVAKLAGVSIQTVSRVVNGHPSVIPETRDQVLSAMRELDYRPNHAARALRSGEFRAIGVVLFTLATTGNVRTLEAITAEAARHGYAITLVPVASPSVEGIHDAFTRLGELAVDAAILLMEVHLFDSSTIPLLPTALEVIVVDSDATHRYSVVDTEQADGARQAVEHLLGLGHHTVWHVTGPQQSYASERRAAAWRETLMAHDRPVPDPLHGDWSTESGYRAGIRLADEPHCTAVFVANDEMALGVLRAFDERGRRVPQDVSVIGFDDIDMAASFQPPLTTVHQDFAEVGRRCVQQLLDGLRTPGNERHTSLVPVRLIERQSTAPPPAR